MSCDATPTLLASVRFSSYVCVLLFWSFQHAVDPLMRVPCFVRMIVCDADWMLRLACACACVCVQCAIHPFKLHAQRWQNRIHTHTLIQAKTKVRIGESNVCARYNSRMLRSVGTLLRFFVHFGAFQQSFLTDYCMRYQIRTGCSIENALRVEWLNQRNRRHGHGALYNVHTHDNMGRSVLHEKFCKNLNQRMNCSV